MSNVSTTESDFAAFEAQFSSVALEQSESQLRVRGWAIALGASAVLWVGAIAGIVAAIHALS